MQNFVEELGMTGSTSFFTAALVGLSSFILFQFQRIWSYQKKLAVVERQHLEDVTDAERLTQLQESNATLTNQVENLKKKNDTLHEKVQSLQALPDAQKEVAAARQAEATLRTELSRLEENREKINQEKQEQSASYEKETTRLLSQQKQYSDDLAASSATITRLREKLETAQKDLVQQDAVQAGGGH